ncbi:hypothetical protein J2S17_004735 [Cytobacillus purgationiresistens]|uniref:Uncharacterized protein n=2 Tax=Cytobacillus purgationiresistens TaxID=863449 RepID=A0ABU0APY7_9BACI|nr:hypothetical protein [Cytobacillus purgationiresistens]
MYIGRTRQDIGAGCKVKLDWEFIEYIITTYQTRKRKMPVHFLKFRESNPNMNMIMLKNKREIAAYIENLQRERESV